MNSAIFITARTESSRLPKKIFLELGKMRTYEFIIERAKNTYAKEVIFCTSNRSEDDTLALYARNRGVKVFRGSLEDKIDRWLSAAKTFNIDYFINHDGDDLFAGIELDNIALDIFEYSDYEYIKAPSNIVTGVFTFGMRTDALERVHRNKISVNEMTFKFFTGLNEVEIPLLPKYLNKEMRLTLDYEEDFLFFKEVFKRLDWTSNTPVSTLSTYKIIEYLESHPELTEINWFREKDFEENQKKILGGN